MDESYAIDELSILETHIGDGGDECFFTFSSFSAFLSAPRTCTGPRRAATSPEMSRFSFLPFSSSTPAKNCSCVAFLLAHHAPREVDAEDVGCGEGSVLMSPQVGGVRPQETP